MGEKVAVLGAGVAGLTAAHELADRGFEVHVYERREIPGGRPVVSVHATGSRLSTASGSFPDFTGTWTTP